MKRVKTLAKRWGDRGEEFTAEDLKLHLNLGVSTRTIAKALKKKGKARWGHRMRGRAGTGASAACNCLNGHALRVLKSCLVADLF